MYVCVAENAELLVFFTFFHAPFPKQPFSCVLLYFRDHEAFVLTYINQAQLPLADPGIKDSSQELVTRKDQHQRHVQVEP